MDANDESAQYAREADHKQTSAFERNFDQDHQQTLTRSREISPQNTSGHRAYGFESQPQPGPSVVNKTGDNTDKVINRIEPYYKCLYCGMETPYTHVIKRHAAEKHIPVYNYYCHHEDGHCTLLREPPHRRGKIMDHYRMHHGGVPSGDIINQRRVMRPCEPMCLFCTQTVQTWKQFYACFAAHCLVEPASSNVGY